MGFLGWALRKSLPSPAHGARAHGPFMRTTGQHVSLSAFACRRSSEVKPFVARPKGQLMFAPLPGRTGHFGGNNVEQQLLPLMLTPYKGHSGVNKSPFWASQVVRGMPECSHIYAFDSQQRSSKPKIGPIQKQHRKVNARGFTVVHLIGACISQAHVSHKSLYLTGGTHLTDVPILWARGYHRRMPLIGMYLIGMHLTGVHLTGVHLTDVHASYGRASHRRASLVGLSRGPLSWASLAGLSRGPLSRACICLRPRACAPYPRPCPRPCPLPPASASAPEPRRSKRTLSTPGHYAV